MLIQDLYTIQAFSYTDNVVEATVNLNKDHAIFKGHFPGNPVMPGVCTMQIIKELLEKALQESLVLVQSTNIKFMTIINPEVSPILSLSLQVSTKDAKYVIKNTTRFNGSEALKLNAVYKTVA